MTPASTALREIAAGLIPADNALLQNCRLEGFGTRAFGREPILDLFRRSPIDFSETLDALESPRALLLVQDKKAIFADLHEGRFTRLWVFGDETLGALEPSVSVPRDLDLSQLEGDVVFDGADHPHLHSSDARRLTELAQPRRMAGLDLPEFSRRSIIVRAFSDLDRMAALIVSAGASGASQRKPLSVNVALLAGASCAPRVVIDRAGLASCSERLWRPRL